MITAALRRIAAGSAAGLRSFVICDLLIQTGKRDFQFFLLLADLFSSRSQEIKSGVDGGIALFRQTHKFRQLIHGETGAS